ncbi:MAG: hypothetical protein KIS94_06060 [Chitinophagales bacterium]|nr:hypothetical protein [Chitinophagales bacterium]
MLITKIKLLAVCLLLTANSFAQSEAELKRVLQGVIDEIFMEWDDEWSYDTYIEESAYISSIKESSYSSNKIDIEGTFKVIRKMLFASGRVSVRFTAKVTRSSNGNVRITSLCWHDPSSPNSEDCVDPGKRWGLGQ